MRMNRASSKKRTWLASTAIAAAVFAACAGLFTFNVFEPIELKSCYFRFFLRGEGKIHPDIALVGISSDDEKKAGQPLPWPREYFAVMIQTLGYYGAKTVAIDFIFSDPKEPEGDKVLAESVKTFRNAVSSFYFELGHPLPDGGGQSEDLLKKLSIRPEEQQDRHLIEGAAARWPLPSLCLPNQVGFINAPLEEDGALLRLPMVMKYRGYVFPSLVLAAACRYYGIKLQDAAVTPGAAIELRPSPERLIQIPIDKKGRMIINFRAGQGVLAERNIPFMGALQAESKRQSGQKSDLDLSQVKGKAVLIAGLLTRGKDVYTTPLGQTFGVAAHVNGLSNILSNDFLRRPGRAVALLILTVCSVLFAVLGAQRSLRKGAIGAAAVLTGYLAVAWFLFAHALIWIEVVAPAANMIALYIAIVTYRFFAEEREKARIRAMFTRYLSPHAVEEVLEKPEEVIFEGELKEVTVLLSDIRDFTPITEALGARETVAMLNEYFEPMVKIVHKYDGAINQFVGDEILATWGAPKGKPGDALNAVKAALAMRDELAALVKSRKERGLKTFAIGIGLNTGEAKVGNIGAYEHMDYAVIGDTVNYAARLESLTKEHLSPDCPTPILMSQSTYERVKDEVDATPIGEIKVKGKKTVSMIYKLNGLRKEEG